MFLLSVIQPIMVPQTYRPFLWVPTLEPLLRPCSKWVEVEEMSQRLSIIVKKVLYQPRMPWSRLQTCSWGTCILPLVKALIPT